MARIIRVTGKGKVSVAPDTVRLNLSADGCEWEYDESVKAAAVALSELQECLEKIGLDRKELKTLSFGVNANYEYRRKANGEGESCFTGYKFSYRFKLELPIDNKLLSKVLRGLAKTNVAPKGDINYILKNDEPAKNEMLAKAVADSRKKAEVLCMAAGVKLGEVNTINYSWGEIEFVSRSECCDMELAEAGCACDMEMTPDDIDVTDTVTVEWSFV